MCEGAETPGVSGSIDISKIEMLLSMYQRNHYCFPLCNKPKSEYSNNMSMMKKSIWYDKPRVELNHSVLPHKILCKANLSDISELCNTTDNKVKYFFTPS